MVCWGRNSQFTDTTDAAKVLPTLAAANWMAVGAGQLHSCGLHGSGTMDCWGDPLYAQVINGTRPWTTLTVGYYHTCAIDDQQHMHCAGTGCSEFTPSACDVPPRAPSGTVKL